MPSAPWLVLPIALVGSVPEQAALVPMYLGFGQMAFLQVAKGWMWCEAGISKEKEVSYMQTAVGICLAAQFSRKENCELQLENLLSTSQELAGKH